MKNITTKIAKNGSRIYYVDGKRVSRDKAEQIERDARREAFTKEIRETINGILDEYEAKYGIMHVETEGYTATVSQRIYCTEVGVNRIYSNLDDAINAVRYFADNPIERLADYLREGEVTTTERVERFVSNTTKYFTYSNYYSHNQYKYTAAYFGANGCDESAFDYLPDLNELNDVDIDDDDDDNNNDTQSVTEDFVEEYIFIDAAPVNHIVKVKCTCTIINGEKLLTQAGTPRIVRSDKYGAEIQFMANGNIAYYTFDDKNFDRQAEADFFAIMADRGACTIEPDEPEPAAMSDDISDICKYNPDVEDDDKPCRLDWDDSAIGNTEDDSDKIFADPAAYAAAVEAAFKAQYPEGKAILKPAC